MRALGALTVVLFAGMVVGALSGWPAGVVIGLLLASFASAGFFGDALAKHDIRERNRR
jgi:hypothetical protein